MGERAQARLFPIPRHPSATTATTRANRRAARSFAAAQGFATWDRNEWACAESHRDLGIHGSTIGGILIPRPSSPAGPLVLCWDCVAYPGAPVRNWEWWSTDADRGDNCIRCDLPMRNRSGSYGRGGPFCWECGSPDKAAHEAWLIVVRSAPTLRPPWAGDKVARS